MECLRNIRSILSEIDHKDRLKFCKVDYENSIKNLKRQKHLWSNDLFKEAVSIKLQFFNTSLFARLPEILLVEIILWLPTNALHTLLTVSTEWKTIAMSNELWGALYTRKYLLHNPRGTIPSLKTDHNIMHCYHTRLLSPEIGDKVEVAWRGKFRLETQDVYQGLAWWVAEIVDKHAGQDRYKIRYPGWDSRWDEWVPRSRLRWTVQENIIESINAGDIVELWCCGTNVPGAWLETKVKRTRHNRYCLGKVLSSGSLWVERNRIRLVRRGKGIYRGDRNSDSDLTGDDHSSSSPLSRPLRRSRRFFLNTWSSVFPPRASTAATTATAQDDPINGPNTTAAVTAITTPPNNNATTIASSCTIM